MRPDSERGDLEDAVLRVVSDYMEQHGYPPSRREVAAQLNRRVATVQAAFERLVKSGRINARPGGARTYQLVPPTEQMIPPVTEM